MTALLLDHLWQSTLFAAATALLTLAFTANSAGVRYWLWFAASVKFLIPFSAMTALSTHIFHSFASNSPSPILSDLQPAANPFSGAEPVLVAPGAASPIAPGIDWAPLVLGLWALGFAVILATWLGRWLKLRAALAGALPLSIDAPMPVKCSAASLEPGLIGIWRPVLLLPQGIESHLSLPEMRAVVAHEHCHLRRRDNLLAAIHMAVEALFWFHPLVWWLGARLIAERENACDEAVLSSGSDPQIYAESILKVCKFYMHSPLECASGVSGADLKRRIEAIMAERFSIPLSVTKKLALISTAVAVIVVPVSLGLLATPPAVAQPDTSGPRFGSQAPLSKTPIREWLLRCDANKDTCDNQLGFVELAYINNPINAVVCVPSTAHDDPSTPIIAWLKAHPDILEMTANKGIGLAIENLYPCNHNTSAQSRTSPPPETWPALQCLLGMGPKQCEMGFERPVTIAHCAEQYAHERLDNCQTGPLSVVVYLGANATGADVYSVIDRHMDSTFIISIPGPDGKVPQYCYFGRPPASSFQGVCNDGHRVDASTLVATSPARPARTLWHNPQ